MTQYASRKQNPKRLPILIPILAVSEKFKNIEAQCEEQMTKLKLIQKVSQTYGLPLVNQLNLT